MFVITGSECLIVRIPHASIAHSASVPCLWSQRVSAWFSEFHMHPWCSFCFCAMFVITGSKCLIVRIPHESIVLILLLCHVCDHREWVLDCQNSIWIHGAHSASVPCLWSQLVSAWLSICHMHPWCSSCFCAMFVITGSECLIVYIPHAFMVLILLLCHVCDHSEWVLDCHNSTCIYGAYSASVPCLWSQGVSAWLSIFHMQPWCSFCFCVVFVITASECLIVYIPHAFMVLILLLCHVCDHRMWVLDCQNSTCIHGAHSASVPCLWSQQVSAWLSEFHMHPWCSFCFCLMLVITGGKSSILPFHFFTSIDNIWQIAFPPYFSIGASCNHLYSFFGDVDINYICRHQYLPPKFKSWLSALVSNSHLFNLAQSYS